MLWSARKTDWRSVALLALLVLLGCQERGHTHEHEHEHEHAHAHGDEPEPVAITRWTDDYELFVELDAPRPNQPVAYHAHVTVLDGFQPVHDGTFTVQYRKGNQTVAEARIEGVARPGIFTPTAPAPPAGSYELVMTFEHREQSAVFACGSIEVTDAERGGAPADQRELPFLKEQQWKVPFATAWASRRPMAREIELPAMLQASGADQLTVSSPTGGRFFHHEGVALAEGIVLKKGTVIGTVAPTVAGDDFSRLQLAVDEGQLEQRRLQAEHKRIKPLVDEGILPRKRLTEVDAQLAAATARLKSARRRIGEVISPGGGGGISIVATRSGTVAQVLVDNGAPVAPGEALVRLQGEGPLWAQARFVNRPTQDLLGAQPVALRVGGQRIALGSDASFLSSMPIVDQSSQLASWTAKLGDLPPNTEGVAVKPGVAAVLLARVGTPIERVVVPVSAVTEINTQWFVFVQTGGESFHKRRITLGVRDGDYVEVVEGVRDHERVVTRGGFDIHLAAVMGTVESHRH